MKRKIVFFCIPAHGHTNPTLSVVRELVGRGHEVWYYSFEPFRQKIEEAGARFIPCDAYDAQSKIKPEDAKRVGKDLAFSTHLLVETTLGLDEHVCRDMAQLQPDCIVADSMAVWGKAVALKRGIPFVSSTTTFAFNRHSAQVMKQSMTDLLKLLLAMPKINRDLKRLRSCGYPVKSVLDLIQNDENTHTIVYTSPEFQPSSETFSDRYAFVGPLIRPCETVVEKTREKMIYISLGTVNNDMPGFYRSCIEAFRDTEYQVILSVGDQLDPDKLGCCAENITVARHVDQIAVLEKADVFVTHCGMNSVNEALYFETPLVMWPQTPEQGGVAARTAELGAGIMLGGTTPAAILEAVERVLADGTMSKNAAKIASDFRRCSGAAGAADKILQVCENG